MQKIKRQDGTNDHLTEGKILESIYTINDDDNKGTTMSLSLE